MRFGRIVIEELLPFITCRWVYLPRYYDRGAKAMTIIISACLLNLWINPCTIGSCASDVIVNTQEVNYINIGHEDGHTPQVHMKNGDSFFLPNESMRSINEKMKCVGK